MKKVLLIGAGAVGQVYGHHFQRGGADVGFLVRSAYAEAARKGFDLYPMNRRHPRREPTRFEGFEVHTDLALAMQTRWDVVVLCLSSTALRKGTWLDALRAHLGDATLCTLTPGMGDWEYLTDRFPTSQLVGGLIGLSSYPGPLPGETLPTPGMVYWVPPLTKMTFSGPVARTQPIVQTLTRGGLKSKQVADVNVSSAFAGPILQFQMVALELSGWCFRSLRKDKALMRLAHRATREAITLAATQMQRKVPLGVRLIRPWTIRLLTRLMPVVAPIDMERFFALHFTKVGDQTVHGLDTLIAEAQRLSCAHVGISELRERLLQARADAA